jgi:hypothetical protein
LSLALEVPIAVRHPVGLPPDAATGAVAARRSWRDNRGLLVPAEEVATSGMQGGWDPANADREPVGLERVTASGLMLIWPEKQGWPQYIGALVALDGKVLFDADGRFLIEPVRDAIGRMLHLAPRFRQVLYWPRPGLGWPGVGRCPIV